MKIQLQLAVLVLFLLRTAMSSQDFAFGPGRVTWWTETWSKGPILPNIDHTGASELTFNLRLDHALDGGFIIISAPDLPENAVGPISIPSNTDYSLTVEFAGLHSSGHYGPFAIQTRTERDGRILDINNVFGSIYLTHSPPVQTMSVTYLSSAEVDPHLTFVFSLETELLPYDLLELIVPSTITSRASPRCFLTDGFHKDVCMNAMDEVACEVTDQERITVYGLTEGLRASPNGVYLSLCQANFDGVSDEWVSHSDWYLQARRLGTNTRLAEYWREGSRRLSEATGVLDCTIEGVNVELNEIVSGLTVYTKFTCTTNHEIPANGKLSLFMENVEFNEGGGGPNVCYSSYGRCTYQDTTITVSLSQDESVRAGVKVYVYAYVTFYEGAEMEVAQSSNEAGEIIDELIEVVSVELGTDRDNARFKITLADNDEGSTKKSRDNGARAKYFMISWKEHELPKDIKTLTLTCPLSQKLSLTEIQISRKADWTYADSNDDQDDGEDLEVDPDIRGNVIDLAKARISFLWFWTEHLDYEEDYSLAATDDVRAPLIQTNLLTFYECVLRGTAYSSDDVIGTYKFDVVADSGYKTKLAIDTLCRDALDGLPLYIELDPEWELDESFIMTLEFDSGPCTETENSNRVLSIDPANFIARCVGESVEIQWTGTLDDETLLYLPVPADAVATKLQVYRTASSLRDIIFNANLDLPERTVPTGHPTIPSFPGNVTTVLNEGITLSFVLNSIERGEFIGVLNLPEDATISSGFFSVLEGERYLFKSVANPDYMNQALFIYEGPSRSITELVVEFTITYYMPSVQHLYLYHAKGREPGDDDPRGACRSVKQSDDPVTFEVGAISNVTVTAFETESIYNLEVKFRGQSTVMTGGWMEVVFYDFGKLPESCTVAGLQPIDEDGVQCWVDPTSHKAQISNFLKVNSGYTVTLDVNDLTLDQTGYILHLCVKSISTYISQIVEGERIDRVEYGMNDACGNILTGYPGNSTTFSASFYPNAPGIPADLFISFEVSANLERGTELKITHTGVFMAHPLPYCWTNFEFSLCSLSSHELKLELSERIYAGNSIQIYVDNALRPSAEETSFSVIATYGIQTIVNDELFNIFWGVRPGVAPVLSSSNVAVAPSITTIGEESDYTISYIPSVGISPSDTVWLKFPMHFNPELGKAEQVFELSGDSRTYLVCSVNNIEWHCPVNHWRVSLSGISISAGELFEVTLKGILNPATPSHTLAYALVAEDGTVLEYNEHLSVVLDTQTPSLLHMHSVTPATRDFGASSSYDFHLFDVKVVGASALVVVFPPQFSSLNAELQCWITEGTTNEVLSDSLSCADTTSSLSIAVDANTGIYEDHPIHLMVSDVKNPVWGFTRDPYSSSDLDLLLSDSAVYAQYSAWCSKFSLLHVSRNKVTQKSYDHLNAAYSGFGTGETTLSLSLTTNEKLQVCRGTTSSLHSIYPEDGKPLATNSVAIRGEKTNSLEVTVPSSVFQCGEEKLNFYVSVPAEVPQGLHTIEWSVSSADTMCGKVYTGLKRTRVEVVDCEPTVVRVPEKARVYGTHSVPLKVELSASPAIGLTIELSSPSTYRLNPRNLEFSPGETVKYFTVENQFNSSLTSTINYSLAGVDASQYQQPSTTQIQADSLDQQQSLEVGLILNSNQAVATVSGSAKGTVYWYLTCKFGKSHQPMPLEKLYSQVNQDLGRSNRLRMPSFELEHSEFYRELTKNHCENYLAGAFPYEGIVTTFSIEGVRDGVDYVFGAYLVDPGDSVSNHKQPKTNTAIGHAMHSRYKFTLDFGRDVLTEASPDPVCTLAHHMHISPSLLSLIPEESSQSTVTYVVGYNPFSSGTSPAAYIETIDFPNLYQDLATEFTVEAQEIQSRYAELRLPGDSGFQVQSVRSEATMIKFYVEAAITGWFCTLCLPEHIDGIQIEPSVMEVYYGMVPSMNTRHQCVKVVAEVPNQLVFNGVNEELKYNCSHAFATLDPYAPIIVTGLQYTFVTMSGVGITLNALIILSLFS